MSLRLISCAHVHCVPMFTLLLVCIDLIAVMSELLPVADRWKNIGLVLRLDPDKLNVIEKDNRNSEDCLTKTLELWLNDTNQWGPPSWRLLATAVGDPVGGNNCALAKKITKNHVTRKT